MTGRGGRAGDGPSESIRFSTFSDFEIASGGIDLCGCTETTSTSAVSVTTTGTGFGDCAGAISEISVTLTALCTLISGDSVEAVACGDKEGVWPVASRASRFSNSNCRSRSRRKAISSSTVGGVGAGSLS